MARTALLFAFDTERGVACGWGGGWWGWWWVGGGGGRVSRSPCHFSTEIDITVYLLLKTIMTVIITHTLNHMRYKHHK